MKNVDELFLQISSSSGKAFNYDDDDEFDTKPKSNSTVEAKSDVKVADVKTESDSKKSADVVSDVKPVEDFKKSSDIEIPKSEPAEVKKDEPTKDKTQEKESNSGEDDEDFNIQGDDASVGNGTVIAKSPFDEDDDLSQPGKGDKIIEDTEAIDSENPEDSDDELKVETTVEKNSAFSLTIPSVLLIISFLHSLV